MVETFDDLPSFAEVREPTELEAGSFNFWNVQASGDDLQDQAAGEALANEAIIYAQRHRSHAAIAFALVAIAERGCVGTMEAAFIERIARSARLGSLN